MDEKKINARIIHKHDIEANWLKAVNFVPKQAEIIVYDVEIDSSGNVLMLPENRTEPYSYERFKIGDGITLVNDLPFSSTADLTNYALITDVSKIVYQTLEYIYPVGAIYISATATNPADIFKFGEWEQIKDTFLLGAGDTYTAGTTGGESSVKLTQSQVPSVVGDITMHSGGSATNISNTSGCFSAQIVNHNQYRNGGTVGYTADSIGIIHFDNGGQDAAHNNMPPYLVVYVWKRTA